MIIDLPPLTETEEYRNTAEIFRDLAAQVRLTEHAQSSSASRQISIGWPRMLRVNRLRAQLIARATSETSARNSDGSQQEHQRDKFGVSRT